MLVSIILHTDWFLEICTFVLGYDTKAIYGVGIIALVYANLSVKIFAHDVLPQTCCIQAQYMLL